MEDLSIEAQMTFKHVKFEDSPTMRALEKVAKEKGLVKPEALQKQASAPKKPDLTPSDDLMENILKLCNGLRSKGLVKAASEIEVNYLNYKQAQTLYETSKEKGEDLVDTAHPKGSHKLENVEGDEAVIETIVDQHLKHLQMIDKKPTGKLADASQVIKAVKRVLGQQQSAQQLLKESSDLVNRAITIAGKGGGLSDTVFNWAKGRAAKVAAIATKTDQELILNDATDAVDAINAISRNLHPNLLHNYLPEFLNKGISSDDVWERVEGILNSAIQKATDAKGIITAGALTEGAPAQPATTTVQQLKEFTPGETPLSSLYRRIGTLRQKLQSYKLIGNISSNPRAVGWINDELKELQDLANRIGQVPENMEGEMSKQLEPELAEFEKDVTGFASQWIQSR